MAGAPVANLDHETNLRMEGKDDRNTHKKNPQNKTVKESEATKLIKLSYLCVRAKSTQSCLTRCYPTDCSPPVSSVRGILQARILEWVAMPSARGSSQPRDWTHILMPPALVGGFLTTRATCGALNSTPLNFYYGFVGGAGGTESACSAGDPGSIPGLGKSPGEGNDNPLQYPCLENPMDRGAWWATVHGVTKSQTRLSNSHSHIHFQISITGEKNIKAVIIHVSIIYLWPKEFHT